ncbi:hypothetical protein ACIBF1_42575 [Spirillospora sp. NPDC050679]
MSRELNPANVAAGDYPLRRLAESLSFPVLAFGGPVPPRPAGAARPSPPRRADPASVAAAVQADLRDRRRIAVLFEAGPEDLVLLRHVASLCGADGRRPLVLVPERTGPPTATSLATAAMERLAGPAAGFDVQVLEPEAQRAARAWRPAGPAASPRETALPAALAAARSWGAEVLLLADEAERLGPAAAARPVESLRRVGEGLAAVRALAAPHRRTALAHSAAWAARLAAPGRNGFLSRIAAARYRLVRSPWYDQDGQPYPPVSAPLLRPGVGTVAGGRAALAGLLPDDGHGGLPEDDPRERPRTITAADLPCLSRLGLLDTRRTAFTGVRLPAALEGAERWAEAHGDAADLIPPGGRAPRLAPGPR